MRDSPRCQLPAARYCLTTLAGMRPRGETSIPFASAQGRTDFGSTSDFTVAAHERICVVYQAMCIVEAVEQ